MAVAVVAPFAPVGPAYAGHSTTEQAIVPNGLLQFTVQKNLAYTAGMRVRISATASDSWMEGVIDSYADNLLMVEINLSSGGGGPYKDWNINLAGEPGLVPTYAGSATNALLMESHGGGAASFWLMTLAGTAPTDVHPIPALFMNGALRLITDDSVYTTIPNGTTLGVTDQLPFRVWLLLIDDNGVLKLGAIQTHKASDHSIKAFPPDGIIPASMFATAGAVDGQVYTISLITGPRQFIVMGFADYDSGLPTAGNWSIAPTRIVMFGPGVKMPGDELQTCIYRDGSYGGYGSILIPIDDTVPEITEGISVLAQAITPRCPQSVIEIEAQAMVSMDAGLKLTAALCSTRSSSASAVTWTEKLVGSVYLWVRDFAFNTVAITYQVRIGTSGAGSMAVNGGTSGPVFGGTCNSYLTIIERQT